MQENHKAGFVNIIGHPNVGKSTLLNELMGEKMVITTSKPQTTRHRIIGIVNDDQHQIVFSDTPGLIKKTHYKMQDMMNSFIQTTFEDGDVMIFVTDPYDTWDEDEKMWQKLRDSKTVKFLAINKIDLVSEERIQKVREHWTNLIKFDEVIEMSALKGINTEKIIDSIKKHLPLSQPYYPKDQFTDRSERFFISEIIREKILKMYRQEIPYSVEVVVDEFEETETNKGEELVKIFAYIYVSRSSQKGILLGPKGAMIKKLATQSRLDSEKFLKKKVFLELFIKIKDNWRNDETLLKSFGYKG